MPTPSKRLLRHLIALAAVPITAIASLVMAVSNAGIGAHLIELWLVGWISLLLLALPATALLGRLALSSSTDRGHHSSHIHSSDRGQLRS